MQSWLTKQLICTTVLGCCQFMDIDNWFKLLAALRWIWIGRSLRRSGLEIAKCQFCFVIWTGILSVLAVVCGSAREFNKILNVCLSSPVGWFTVKFPQRHHLPFGYIGFGKQDVIVIDGYQAPGRHERGQDTKHHTGRPTSLR